MEISRQDRDLQLLTNLNNLSGKILDLVLEARLSTITHKIPLKILA